MRYTLLMILLSPIVSVTAQTEPRVQEIYGSLTDTLVAYSLIDLQAGTTLYVYAESSEFDTLVLVTDFNGENVLAENDDINTADMAGTDNYNSALKFTIPENDDYLLSIADCCDENATGDFRVLIGINAPQVITGTAEPTGAEIAVQQTETPSLPHSGDVQFITGSLNAAEGQVFYDIRGLEAGQTIYIFAESDDFDTYILLGDFNFDEVFVEDDDAGGGTNSALLHEIQQDGDYSIAITDCCSEEGAGEFTLVIGIDVPEVLINVAEDTGAHIAVLFDTTGFVDKTEMTITDCSTLQERPPLSGPEYIRETENFVIHYTNTGRDGATPNFVDEVEQIVEQVLDYQIHVMGWPLPPPDCGEGGDTRFDVYLVELVRDGYLGYAEPGGLRGDNPNSEHVEEYSAYSYLVIDNNFAGVPAPRPIMRVTVAHEFHHNIQQGYDLDDYAHWYYEATSTWMETQTFKEDEDATPYTYDLFQSADYCIGSRPEAFSSRMYAEWTLIDNLARDFGTDSIQLLWEYVADYEGMDAFYEYLDELGISPQELMQRFAIRNLLLDYELGERFPTRVRIESNINRFGEVIPRQNGVQELGVDYLLVRNRDIYTFTIDQPNLELVVVGVDQPNNTATIFELEQRGTVDTTPFTYTYVLVLNTDLHSNSEACRFTDWVLTVESGAGKALAEPLDEIFDASKFVPAG